MNPQEPHKAQKKKISPQMNVFLRCGAIGLAFVIACGYLVHQLKRVQVDEYDDWRARATAQQLSTTEITPERGNIYDRNGNTLAENIMVWTVDMYPDLLHKSEYFDSKAAGTEDIARFVSEQLSEIIGVDAANLYDNIKDEKVQYYRIRGQIDRPQYDAIRELASEYNIRGIGLIADSKRYYQYTELASTILGFVNEGGGVEGLENKYEEVLAGVPGREISVVNALGGEMPAGTDSITYSPTNGYNLELTLDIEIQAILEKYLYEAIEQNEAAESGVGIVMDVKTGAILAMVGGGGYDPNNPYYIYDDATRAALEEITDTEEYNAFQSAARQAQWRNKALADTYEPGSVFKVITAAAALDSGMFTQYSPFYCSGSTMVSGWHDPIRCAGGKAHGSLPLSEALIVSCNVSFITMSAAIGISTWYDYLNAFGFTEPTGVDMSGEPSQRTIDVLVHSEESMSLVDLAVASFGQSNKYTPLQVITAVSAAVNGGHLMQPYVVSAITDSNGNVMESFDPIEKRQVISAETSEVLAGILEELVNGDNGKNAYVAGYHVGGKSGTSEKTEIRTAEGRDAYISSFLGFAPANDPEVAVLIILDEPTDRSGYGTYFGGRMAGPAVGAIMADILPILEVEPDYGSSEELLRTTVTAPTVTGLTAQNAQVELNKYGMKAIEVGSGTTVTSQYPEAGTAMPYAGQVVLYYGGATAETTTMPNVVGLTPEQARSTLNDSGLNVLTTGAPDGGAGVAVATQSEEAGATVLKGTTITLNLQDTTNSGDL